jgi:hypothetical protein
MLVLLAVAATVAGLAASASAGVHRQPILSPKAYPYLRFSGLKNTIGFGQVKPRKIYFGGDETGLVCGIHWHGWGNRTARGTGVAWYVGRRGPIAAGHGAVATVVVSKLGRWKGRPAYDKLRWSFPHHGRERAALCGV